MQSSFFYTPLNAEKTCIHFNEKCIWHEKCVAKVYLCSILEIGEWWWSGGTVSYYRGLKHVPKCDGSLKPLSNFSFDFFEKFFSRLFRANSSVLKLCRSYLNRFNNTIVGWPMKILQWPLCYLPVYNMDGAIAYVTWSMNAI